MLSLNCNRHQAIYQQFNNIVKDKNPGSKGIYKASGKFIFWYIRENGLVETVEFNYYNIPVIFYLRFKLNLVKWNQRNDDYKVYL